MIIHLTGPDTFRSQRRFTQLREAFQHKHDPSGFNVSVVDGQTATPEALRTAIQTVGFFSPKRFVGINHYFPSQAATPPESMIELLTPLAKDDNTIVVVREIAEPRSTKSGKPKSSKRTPKMGLQLAAAKHEEFPNLNQTEVERWAKQEFDGLQSKIEPTALRLLVEWCGSDLWRLHGEIQKLATFAAERMITRADVEHFIQSPETSDVFALTDALGQRQTAAALHLLEREIAAGTHPLALISLLATHIRRLLMIQLAHTQGQTPAAIARDLGIHPFVVKKGLAQTKNFAVEDLRRWHHQLVEIDLTLKSSPLDATTLLEVLILRG